MTELTNAFVESTTMSTTMSTRPRGTSWTAGRDSPPAEATVRWADDDLDVTSVLITGVMCTLTVCHMRPFIDDVAANSRADVLIDMSGVSFIDGRGLSLVIRTRRVLAERGLECRVIDASDTVRRLFHIARLDDLLTG